MEINLINKKNLKNKKNSIKHIHKITKSMEMISISKYKILNKKIINSNRYINNFLKFISHINFNNHFLVKTNSYIKNILYIVISTNQGLCGNINNNIYKKIILDIKNNYFSNKNIYLFLWGKKNFFLINKLKSLNIKFKMFKKKIFSYNIWNYNKNNILNKIINFYKKKHNTIVFIVFNLFKQNRYVIQIDQLLPVINYKNKTDKIIYLYEDNKNILYDDLLSTYINSKINNSILSNIICEYFSRILVMKNASLNTENLFKKLDLEYNKIRQFSITKEIIELTSNINIL